MKGREVSRFPPVSSGIDIMLPDNIFNIEVFPDIHSINPVIYKVNPNPSYGPFHGVERTSVMSFILQTRKPRLRERWAPCRPGT